MRTPPRCLLRRRVRADCGPSTGSHTLYRRLRVCVYTFSATSLLAAADVGSVAGSLNLLRVLAAAPWAPFAALAAHLVSLLAQAGTAAACVAVLRWAGARSRGRGRC